MQNINPPSGTGFLAVLDSIMSNDQVLRATKYVSPKQIIRAVRKSYRYNNHKPLKNENITITLTFGRPNYLEREFIKLCQKAKEPFPVKKVQLKFYVPKKGKLKRK